MFTAELHGDRIPAAPHVTGAMCPLCRSAVTPKCGGIVTWHWAHAAREDCDTWAEPDTLWHKTWQSLVPPEQREVVIGNHRADIVAGDGTVVELQHSSISTDEIRKREQHYQRMIWIFDGIEAHREDRFQLRRTLSGGLRTFRWMHPRKTIAACKAPVYLNITGGIFRIRKIHPAAPCGGYGNLVSLEALLGAILTRPVSA